MLLKAAEPLGTRNTRPLGGSQQLSRPCFQPAYSASAPRVSTPLGTEGARGAWPALRYRSCPRAPHPRVRGSLPGHGPMAADADAAFPPPAAGRSAEPPAGRCHLRGPVPPRGAERRRKRRRRRRRGRAAPGSLFRGRAQPSAPREVRSAAAPAPPRPGRPPGAASGGAEPQPIWCLCFAWRQSQRGPSGASGNNCRSLCSSPLGGREREREGGKKGRREGRKRGRERERKKETRSPPLRALPHATTRAPDPRPSVPARRASRSGGGWAATERVRAAG